MLLEHVWRTLKGTHVNSVKMLKDIIQQHVTLTCTCPKVMQKLICQTRNQCRCLRNTTRQVKRMLL